MGICLPRLEMSALISACILWRSGDVGIGLNVRRMQTQLMGSFTTAYSLRPVGDVGSVFRRFPEPWKVFVEDSETQGRYVLAAERDSRPAGEGKMLSERVYVWRPCEALSTRSPESQTSWHPLISLLQWHFH